MNRTVFVGIFAVVFALAASAPGAMVNWYQFENNLNDSATGGSTSTTLSISGNGSPTAIYEAGLLSRAGTALHVAGDSNNGSGGQAHLDTVGYQVDFPASDADIDLGSTFTIEFWVYGKHNSFGNTTVIHFLIANNYEIELSDHGWTSGLTKPTVYGGAQGSGHAMDSTKWQHCALVVNGTNWTYYIEPGKGGTAEFSFSGTAGAASTTTSLRVNTDYTAGSYADTFDGVIDDLVMWDEALSLATLTQHGTWDSPVPEPSAMVVLALGGMGVWLRRRRKR